MSKFNKGKKKGMQELSTASLPDIVFMLLFFFMVTTVMREQDVLVKISLPEASEIEKIVKKDLVDYINIGVPFDKGKLGSEPLLQLDDAIASVDKVAAWVEANRKARSENVKSAIINSFKVDEGTEMRMVTDVKQELRKLNSLNINYSTREKSRTGSK